MSPLPLQQPTTVHDPLSPPTLTHWPAYHWPCTPSNSHALDSKWVQDETARDPTSGRSQIWWFPLVKSTSRHRERHRFSLTLSKPSGKLNVYGAVWNAHVSSMSFWVGGFAERRDRVCHGVWRARWHIVHHIWHKIRTRGQAVRCKIFLPIPHYWLSWYRTQQTTPSLHIRGQCGSADRDSTTTTRASQ